MNYYVNCLLFVVKNELQLHEFHSISNSSNLFFQLYIILLAPSNSVKLQFKTILFSILNGAKIKLLIYVILYRST